MEMVCHTWSVVLGGGALHQCKPEHIQIGGPGCTRSHQPLKGLSKRLFKLSSLFYSVGRRCTKFESSNRHIFLKLAFRILPELEQRSGAAVDDVQVLRDQALGGVTGYNVTTRDLAIQRMKKQSDRT